MYIQMYQLRISNQSLFYAIHLTFHLQSTYTGCSVNFFRSFAPALIALDFRDLWCYFVGQVLSLLVPVLWRLVIEDVEPDIRY